MTTEAPGNAAGTASGTTTSHRILVVSNFFPPRTVGGAEEVAFRQARAYAELGHDVTVLAGAEPTTEAPAGQLWFDRHGGLPVYRLALRSLDADRNFSWPAAARRLTALVNARRIQVVHAHNLTGLGANLIPASKRAGARCIVTLHDSWGFCLRATRLTPDGGVCVNYDNCAKCLAAITSDDGMELPVRLRRDYVAWCLSQADALISPSRFLAESYREAGFPPEQINVVSNGIDLEEFSHAKQPSPDGGVRFFCAAYLGEHKGILVLLQALKQLAADTGLAGRWSLDIAGDGHLRQAVEKAIGEPGLGRHARLLGRVPRAEVLERLGRTDVVVLPSTHTENEPVSLLEAIASGCAQIASDIGGIPELVEHERGGCLVPPGDAAALAGAMRRYILDPGLARRHGEYNFARRGQFDQARSLPAICDILFATERANTPPVRSQPVVICGAGSAGPAVQALARSLHRHQWPGVTPRLIWHDWADALAWREARLVWLWDNHRHEIIVNEAIARGIPILAPHSDWCAGLERHHGAVRTYRTWLEALAALRVLTGMPDLTAGLASFARHASSAAAALASRASFDLRAEAAG